jgi:hypothetical protein
MTENTIRRVHDLSHGARCLSGNSLYYDEGLLYDYTVACTRCMHQIRRSFTVPLDATKDERWDLFDKYREELIKEISNIECKIYQHQFRLL